MSTEPESLDLSPPGEGESPPTEFPSGDQYTLMQFTPCVRCGYDLRGLQSTGTCPECGTPVGLSMPDYPFVYAPDPALVIENEIPCTRCGASLQSRSSEDQCVCGAPVWFSIHGTWLRASDPVWLARVRSGFTLWLWSIGVSALIILISMGIGVAIGLSGAFQSASTGGTPNSQAQMAMFQENNWMLMLPMLILSLFKPFIAYRVSTADPRKLISKDGEPLQTVMRFLGISAMVLPFVASVIIMWQPPSWLQALLGLTHLLGVAFTVTLLIYMRGFFHRVAKPKIARHTTIVMWGWGITLAVQQIVGCVSLFFIDPNNIMQMSGTTPSIPSSWLIIATMSGCIIAPGLLIFGIWLLILIVRIRGEFSTALAQVIHDTAPTE